jgi:hypothetical protein
MKIVNQRANAEAVAEGNRQQGYDAMISVGSGMMTGR